MGLHTYTVCHGVKAWTRLCNISSRQSDFCLICFQGNPFFCISNICISISINLIWPLFRQTEFRNKAKTCLGNLHEPTSLRGRRMSLVMMKASTSAVTMMSSSRTNSRSNASSLKMYEDKKTSERKTNEPSEGTSEADLIRFLAIELNRPWFTQCCQDFFYFT